MINDIINFLYFKFDDTYNYKESYNELYNKLKNNFSYEEFLKFEALLSQSSIDIGSDYYKRGFNDCIKLLSSLHTCKD